MEVALGYFEDDDVGDRYADIDLDRPPMSGAEYLKQVQLEAARCPDVVIATETPPQKQNYVLEEIVTQALDVSKTFPDENTQLKMSEDFAYLRQNFNRVKAAPVTNLKIPKSVLPSGMTSQVWCRFCFGKDFDKKCFEAKMKSTQEHNNTAPIMNEGATHGQGTAPLLSVMLNLKQKVVVKLLDYHSTWLDTVGFSYDQGCWLFSLLLCLDKPLPSEVTSTLRDICRRVITIRNALKPSEENEDLLHQLNLLIIIVTRFFGQYDLAKSLSGKK